MRPVRLAPLLVASLLSGCQTLSASQVGSMPRPSFNLAASGGEAPVAVAGDRPIAQGGTLSVDFASALGLPSASKRRVLATVADVAKVVVTVKTADGASASQTVLKAAITAGQTTVTFPGLAPGAATVTVEAFDAANKALGSTSKPAAIAVGATTTVDVLVSLEPTLTPVASSGGGGSSTPTTGGVTANVTLQDGLTGIGPVAIGSQPADVEFDGSGNVWVLTGSGGELRKLDADGRLLATYTLPYQYAALYLDIGPDGRVYVTSDGDAFGWVYDANGNNVTPPLFTTKCESNVAFDGAGNVVYGFYHSSDLFTAKPDGTFVSKISLPLVASIVRRDTTGGYWVTNGRLPDMGAGIAKVAANGTVSVKYALPNYAVDLEIDSLGNAWVFDGSAVRRVTPTGQVSQPVADAGRIGRDAAGHIWIRAKSRIAGYNADGTLYRAYSVPTIDNLNLSVVRFDALGRAWVTNAIDGTAVRLTLPL